MTTPTSPYTLPDLPPLLEPYRDQIAASVRPYVKITTDGVRETSLWESKFDGYPYLPKDMAYPHDPDGRPMALIAQINFADVPHLEHYPDSGMLQIFISNHDDVYGSDLDRPLEQAGWRILYHPVTTTDVYSLTTNFSFLANDRELYRWDDEFRHTSFTFAEFLPEDAQGYAIPLNFTFAYEPVRHYTSDYHIQFSNDRFHAHSFFGQVLETEDQVRKLDHLYDETFFEAWTIPKHRIGGYPSFVQGDPRPRGLEWTGLKNASSYSQLLLQIDSERNGLRAEQWKWDINWGDAGIANFFITKDDLSARDFSRVLYNWDCA